jgi:hypothetical protein
VASGQKPGERSQSAGAPPAADVEGCFSRSKQRTRGKGGRERDGETEREMGGGRDKHRQGARGSEREREGGQRGTTVKIRREQERDREE